MMHISYDMLNYDFFPTPIEYVESALSLLPYLKPKWVLDPCAGHGVWGQVARQKWGKAQIVGLDIRKLSRPAAYDWWFQGDFLSIGETPMFDVVMANPPFSLAEEFVRHALRCVKKDGHVMMLLKQSFLSSVGRYSFWQWDCPPRTVYVCSDRPSFGWNGGTSNYEYIFVHWQKDYIGTTNIDWVISKPHNMKNTYRQLHLI